MDNVKVVVLAGGASSRFFPVNKIFADPVGTGRSMIQQAFDRVADDSIDNPTVKPEGFYIATGADFVETMRSQLDQVPEKNILAEPDRRNTLPAILWTMAHIQKETSAETIISIITGDHVIDDSLLFRSTLDKAVKLADNGYNIITIGITPSDDAKEWTSFGAMRSGKNKLLDGIVLEEFTEKPSVAMAEDMIKEGGWYWNAGMFIFKIETMIKALEEHNQEVYNVYIELFEKIANDDFIGAKEAFSKFPSKIPHPAGTGMADNSIDYAVMQPMTRTASSVSAYLIPGTFPWVDIGNWLALYDVLKQDENKNIHVGDVEIIDCQECVVLAEVGNKVTIKGLEKTCVVFAKTGDILISSFDGLNEIKKLFADVNKMESHEIGLTMGCENLDIQGSNVFALCVQDLKITVDNHVVVVEHM
eukprot:TRINITY_DN1350_c0_g1_i1.p1 TRINITY_DN1350_c0_g1~~TRINITY_DN1350_c0_g1_i1.p1  ORF type:complete len:426 (-),score=145.31 TRINITY_DN1350_c0_g1_i1:60-1313(-)